ARHCRAAAESTCGRSKRVALGRARESVEGVAGPAAGVQRRAHAGDLEPALLHRRAHDAGWACAAGNAAGDRGLARGPRCRSCRLARPARRARRRRAGVEIERTALMTTMTRQYARAIVVWALTLTALYLFQYTFGRP